MFVGIKSMVFLLFYFWSECNNLVIGNIYNILYIMLIYCEYILGWKMW